ncbi:GHKL domain-containing protein [Clostridioides sp. ZZV14-6009]|nr:GHKL domain-containing protein [Clostridioides sp. ZZV14-6150]MCC0667878.1 GHKL domain-containing protein [Clostridioides sp. ZZV14-6153]MCC0723690.1 GHKL domain-containing protein [Clostridioides sp. ZZV14-6104]MCC0724876.1 GHKL domain-containing protein [Clostridioides sp. ZZV14-6045]MCC0730752.1 GHKL domain-containing protein [Clostridioides sp. ZZV14-6048]MCC0736701.1 GHKL domain-containing protein [Clostridioides sp. ZZV14-6009]MCC0741489.1 GHKL domain-containing protein [Clostridioid
MEITTMLNISFLITLLSSIIEIWVCKKVFDYTSKIKTNSMKLNISFLIAVFVLIFIFYLNIDPNIRVLICIISTYSIYKFNYRVNFTKCLIVVFSYWMLLIGIDALTMSLTLFINNLDSMNILLEENFYRYECLFISKVFLFFMLFIYKVSFNSVKIGKKEIYLSIPIVSNLISFIIFYKCIFSFINISSSTKFDIMIMALLLTASNIALIVGIIKMLRDNKKYLELLKLQEKTNLEHNYYQNVKNNYIKTKELYHDMKNHIICIKEMSKNNYDTSNYIKNLEKKLDEYNNMFDTGNIALNIILKEKKELCIKKEIRFITGIDFSQCNFINEEDVCSIFANAIDNAIEACDKIKKGNKSISLQGRLINNFFVIKISNTKSNVIIEKKKNFITTKKNKEFHGLGIKSIKNTLEKYAGTATIEFTDTMFSLNILIPLNNPYSNNSDITKMTESKSYD